MNGLSNAELDESWRATEAVDLDNTASTPRAAEKKTESLPSDMDRHFMQEDKVEGSLGMATIRSYLKEIGGILPVLLILSSVFLLKITDFLVDYYQVEWSTNFDINYKWEYIPLLIFLLVSRALMTVVRSAFVFGT